jgi:hypothetical protein
MPSRLPPLYLPARSWARRVAAFPTACINITPSRPVGPLLLEPYGL